MPLPSTTAAPVARFGILAAMPAEIAALRKVVTDQVEHKRGEVFSFTTGKLEGCEVVFGASNVGMVFAASAATTMISEFGATKLVFSGVAGGLLAGQSIGDIVLGASVINYDMDCRAFKYPWDPSYQLRLGETPFVEWAHVYPADPELLKVARGAPPPAGAALSEGRIASGSKFCDTAMKAEMAATHWCHLGEPACCEMENAAVAQVCRAYSVPYLSLRALSDLATGDAAADFNAFCDAAADNLLPIVRHVVRYSARGQ